MTTRFGTLLLLPLAAFLIAGCTDDPLYPSRQVTVGIVDMPYLENGAYYELWLAYPRDAAQKNPPVVDRAERQFISIGMFRVGPSGEVQGTDGVPASFQVPPGYNPELFSDAIVTIQQSGGSDSLPGAVLLGGTLIRTGGRSVTRLSLNGRDAFGSSLDTLVQDTLVQQNGAIGSFLLDTPTTPSESDYTQGIWFIRSDLKTRGLPLPAQPINPLNPGWEYESWLVHHPGSATPEYISLGRFDSASGRDRNGAGPGAGPNISSAYDVPGEDFVAAGTERMLSDSGYGVVVSLAPKSVPLSHPFIILFQRDTIPVPDVRLQSVDLSPALPSKQPFIDLSFER
jgi:hypothetical protein